MVTRVGLSKRLEAWLLKAQGKDADRPTLNAVHQVGDRVETSNGWTYHAAKVQLQSTDSDVALQPGRYNVKGGIAEPCSYPGDFPDFKQIVPGQVNQIAIDHESAVVLAINPKLLSEALLNQDELVYIVIRSKGQPVEIYGQIDEVPTYAIVMPMNPADNGYTPWNPIHGDVHIADPVIKHLAYNGEPV